MVLYSAASIAALWVLMVSFRFGFHIKEWLVVTLAMWTPGLLSISWRLVFKEGFRDVGWRIGKGRYWAWAYFLPLGFGVASYGLALALQKATIFHGLAEQPMLGVVYFKVPWWFNDASVGVLLAQRLVAVALIGMLPSFLLALGEELGWRGYLLPRLVQTGCRRPVLMSSAVWAVWHLPLLLLTAYGHGPTSVVLHTVLILLLGAFIGWLRLVSGSVWVAAMAHASFNGFVQCFFAPSFVGNDTWLWVGDYGVLTLIPYGLLTAWVYWARAAHAGVPSDRPFNENTA